MENPSLNCTFHLAGPARGTAAGYRGAGGVGEMILEQDTFLAELHDGWSLDRVEDVVVLRADVARVGCPSCYSRDVHQL